MLLTCGDALIDFLPAKMPNGRHALMPMVRRVMSQHRRRHGASRQALASAIDLRYATRSEHHTTLAFVRSGAGESEYAFYDEDSASRNWVYRRGSIPFTDIDAIHIGSTTLVKEACAAQVLAMIRDTVGSASISF